MKLIHTLCELLIVSREEHVMIKIYGTKTCPDCAYICEQIKGNTDNYEFVDIGEHVKNLKEFLVMRDTSPVFEECRTNSYVGIPCFVFEDGKISLVPEDADLNSRPEEM